MTLWPALHIVVVPWFGRDPDALVRWLEADNEAGMSRIVIALDVNDHDARARIDALALPNVQTMVVDSLGSVPEVTVGIRVAGAELVLPVNSTVASDQWMRDNIEMPFVLPPVGSATEDVSITAALPTFPIDALTTVERLEISFAEPAAPMRESKRTTKLPPPIARAIVEPAKAYSILDDYDEDAEYGDGGKIIPASPVLTQTSPVHIQRPVPPAWDNVSAAVPEQRVSYAPRAHPPVTASTPIPRTPPAVPDSRTRKHLAPAETTGQFASVQDLAVAAVIRGGKSVEDVAKTFRLSPSVIALWVSKIDPRRARP